MTYNIDEIRISYVLFIGRKTLLLHYLSGYPPKANQYYVGPKSIRDKITNNQYYR